MQLGEVGFESRPAPLWGLLLPLGCVGVSMAAHTGEREVEEVVGTAHAGGGGGREEYQKPRGEIWRKNRIKELQKKKKSFLFFRLLNSKT